MCLTPIKLKKQEATVPCGRCPKCIARRVSAWSFRLKQEEKKCSSAHFLTLTYDTRHIPINRKGKMVLSKRDIQLFFKRLRKAQFGSTKSDIKYYACGEYGGRTQRPHYHIIIFNAKLELINDSWNKGHIYYGSVTGQSIGYTLKYMTKQKKKGQHKLPGAEFSLMSKGLGISYLENQTMVNWHIKDMVNRVYCTTEQGIKIAMPRYYKDKLYLEQERRLIREAFEIISNKKQLKKLEKSTIRTIRNEKEAVKAAYQRMYHKSLKTKI